jgi:hypothetical protein
MKVVVTYDSGGSFPVEPEFGKGVVRGGELVSITDPSQAGFLYEISDKHDIDERFWTITAPGVMLRKNQADIDAIIAADAAEKAAAIGRAQARQSDLRRVVPDATPVTWADFKSALIELGLRDEE